MDIQELSLPGQIGPYKILRKMASGGMGDIFLAEDPLCHRKLALKRIRADRRKQEGLRERFLKEAQIAAKLSHPCIIPIYQIHISEEEVYYTMPLVEGSTLKEILQTTREQEKEGGSHHPIGSSLLALMRIFLHIGQAMAYAHDKGVLHKDLKPENIIIGPYGEVLILDWGLAEQAGQEKEPLPMEEDKLGSFHLTRPGKVAGTLSYLPPERLYGHRASFASDIYALGVILYQMLTLRFPFQGKDVRQYKQRIKQGKLIDPLERAPYRDIPPQLAHIAKRCLAKHPNKRYPSVNNLLQDLNNYMEGKAEWVPCGGVQVESKEDWLLQENILLSKHISLTREADILEWAHLMVAKRLFSENIKIETHVRIHKTGKGIGFLLHIHPPTGGKGEDFFREGFFLWIGSARSPGIYLFRSNMELLSNPSFFLEENISYFVSVQKIGSHIQLSINGTLVLDYIGHIPLYGPHIGLVLKDESLDVGTLLLSSSSPNIQVHCLTVPDTLLALHHFQEAKEKYREIANSFEGRVEGKEAIYKGGLALLEEAKAQKN
ncbi:MAG: serine/threonine protein kinase, partial [Chlamydiae bacterium]|nr:serine/threonine protein kinase [Chlamydiota bacterium]